MGEPYTAGYPPLPGGSASPNAPPPGIVAPSGPGYPQPGDQMYPPPGGPSPYPPGGQSPYPPIGGSSPYPPPADQGYPPPGGQSAYPPPSDQGYPGGTAGYPPPSGYPPPGGYAPPGSYQPPTAGYPPPDGTTMYQPSATAGYPPPDGTTMYQPSATAGYPTPGTGYPPASNQGAAPGNWMPPPTGVPMCPRGLEYLAMIDQLLIHQKVEMLEAFTSFETKNKYSIKNSLGQKIYTAKEDTDCLTRNCLGTIRPFDIKIKDNVGNEVIHLNRPLRCESCWCPCCLQKLEVSAPPGTVVGYISQEWSILKPSFCIENAAGETVLRIKGPICTFSICGDVEFDMSAANPAGVILDVSTFKPIIWIAVHSDDTWFHQWPQPCAVLSHDGSVEVGKIRKQWSGVLREAFTDADHFGISFPMDLDVGIKAVLLGACFLIDYMFFEKQGNQEKDTIGML